MMARIFPVKRIISICLVFLLAFYIVFGDSVFGYSKEAIALTSDSTGTARTSMGKWKVLPMPAMSDRTQSVHTTLLPNGKVLVVNGSSFRTELDRENGQYQFVEGIDVSDYAVVNNSGLLDPKTGKFERIPSPPALRFDKTIGKNGANTTNDLFCSGHVQLADGNVLFAGGTNTYYPGGAFTGTKWLNLYDWRSGKWKDLGQMRDGRWYPSLISLADGKVAIFAGLKFEKPNQINTSVEIYDPKTDKLHYFDLTTIKNSPFNTKVGNDDIYDGIDLYPRVFPLKDGRLLITGDEAGIAGVLVPHSSKKSYLMTINDLGNGQLSLSFEVGPDRLETSKAYGTALQIPNSEEVLLLGGLIGSNSISYGREGKIDPNAFPPDVVRVSTSLQHWISPAQSAQKNGKWEIIPDFFKQPRANLQAVILPTEEILVLNGGEYPEYKPIYQPLLMTPDSHSLSGYQTKTLNSAKLPRLYHNGAILLPDARVLVIGGNANRTAREKDGTLHVDVLGDPKTFFRFPQLKNKAGEIESFDIDTYYRDPQHYFADGNVEPFVPSEIWQGEIFSPPYLYKAGSRPEITSSPQILKYGQSDRIVVKDGTSNPSVVMVKLGTVTHSFDYGQRLAKLPIKVAQDNSSVGITAPDNPHLYPPGYYMLFYLNDIGKPSHAQIVQLQS
ncbi:galactose oxidase early set domain-containing protein [Pseudanabaena sp. 'Roaring Creek']|uniref:galactose oxidase early set domain-containing protein n=1 Tax=Pseudanabaena sp. 'Roaring Creek' TaxID=1681830 RepID=UPI0006D7EB1D|nr:galactose oxidase early set domain-containing protein [Pseudanabaena sp. 'Roaring Creek']